jgi:hypothetical protein
MGRLRGANPGSLLLLFREHVVLCHALGDSLVPITPLRVEKGGLVVNRAAWAFFNRLGDSRDCPRNRDASTALVRSVHVAENGEAILVGPCNRALDPT